MQSPLRLGDIVEVVAGCSATLRIGRDLLVVGVVLRSGRELRVDRALLISRKV